MLKAMRRQWLPLLVLLMVAIGGFVISRMHGIFGSDTEITREGEAALKHFGKKRWRRHVADVVTRLQAALEADDVVVGGGNAKKLNTLPKGVRLGSNANAFVGGYRLWTHDA